MVQHKQTCEGGTDRDVPWVDHTVFPAARDSLKVSWVTR